MIERSTVLVLGAGASAPYNYPTGAVLRDQIIDGLADGRQKLYKRLWPAGVNENPALVRDFRQKFAASQLPTIDEFLEQHPDAWGHLGRAVIAGVLLPYEDPQELVRRAKPRWYDHLWDTLRLDIDNFTSHKLSIVTFNYDRSLEAYLVGAMQSAYKLHDSEIKECLSHLRFVHVYGSLGGRPFIDDDAREYGFLRYDKLERTEVIKMEAKRIKIVDRTKPDEVDAEFTEAQQLIEQAERIFLLGFSFNETNLKRLDLGNLVRGRRAHLTATTYGMGRMAVQRAEHLLDLGNQFTKHDVECAELFREQDALV